MTPAASDAPAPPAPPAVRVWLRRGAWLLVGGAAALGLAACGLVAAVGHRSAGPPRPASPLPDAVAARFRYRERGSPVTVFAEFNHDPGRRYSSRWVQFPVTNPGEEATHLVQVIYFRAARPGPRPAVVISPILGGDYSVAQAAAAAVALSGMHAAVVLRAESAFDATAPETRLERVLRTAVVDRMRAIDWLQSLPEVDGARIGALGASMGGISTAILAAVEPRIRAAVLVAAAGDLGDVVVRSDERRLRRFVRERGLPPDELRERIRAAVVSDPLRLAPHVDPSRLLLFTTSGDRSVPSDLQDALADALGDPERYELPVGHYGAVAYTPYILARAVTFLERRLDADPDPEAP